jgi:DGQHR domain-containing protein
MNKTLIKARALMAYQDDNIPIYSFFLRAKDLAKAADISRIKKGAKGALLGYQRGEVSQHINEIKDFLNSKSVLFPNAIILALSSEVKFKQSRGPSVGEGPCLSGVLELPIREQGKRAAWIVDGQQRTTALALSNRPDLLVPVTGFVSDNFEIHRAQFLLVNKVKPLPSGLINELLPEVNMALPASLAKNKIPSAICNILNKDPESPFKGLIARQTTDRRKDKAAVVADNSLIQVVKSSLNNVHGCLYQYRNVATGEIDEEKIMQVLKVYWSAVKEVFPDAWGQPPLKSRLMHGVGIKSMGNLMDRVMCTAKPWEEESLKKTVKQLSILKSRCAWTNGSWEQLNGLPWNGLQNTPSHVKLLSNMLIRAYSGVDS